MNNGCIEDVSEEEESAVHVVCASQSIKVLDGRKVTKLNAFYCNLNS